MLHIQRRCSGFHRRRRPTALLWRDFPPGTSRCWAKRCCNIPAAEAPGSTCRWKPVDETNKPLSATWDMKSCSRFSFLQEKHFGFLGLQLEEVPDISGLESHFHLDRGSGKVKVGSETAYVRNQQQLLPCLLAGWSCSGTGHTCRHSAGIRWSFRWAAERGSLWSERRTARLPWGKRAAANRSTGTGNRSCSGCSSRSRPRSADACRSTRPSSGPAHLRRTGQHQVQNPAEAVR